MRALDLIVVLYRRAPAASETLVSLSRIDFAALNLDVEVHIWDNACASPAPPHADLLPVPWRYVASIENVPLSKAYNLLVRQSHRAHVVIFDQDSHVDAAFFGALSAAIDIDEAEVFAPLIRHGERVISPGRLRWIKGAPLPRVSANALLPTNFTAMMSGLCMSRALLARLGEQPFDERLWLYGVDTRFCRDLARHRARAYLTGAQLGHDSALRNTADPAAALQRHIWLWQSWLRVFDRNPFEIVAIRAYVLWKAWRVSRGSPASGRLFQVVAEVFR